MTKVIKANLNKRDWRKCIAVVASILLLSVSIFAAFYVVSEADHDCCGENCPICAHIDQFEAILKNTGDGAAAIAVMALLLVISNAVSLGYETESFAFSLITSKVRMNN